MHSQTENTTGNYIGLNPIYIKFYIQTAYGFNPIWNRNYIRRTIWPPHTIEIWILMLCSLKPPHWRSHTIMKDHHQQYGAFGIRRRKFSVQSICKTLFPNNDFKRSPCVITVSSIKRYYSQRTTYSIVKILRSAVSNDNFARFKDFSELTTLILLKQEPHIQSLRIMLCSKNLKLSILHLILVESLAPNGTSTAIKYNRF